MLDEAKSTLPAMGDSFADDVEARTCLDDRTTAKVFFPPFMPEDLQDLLDRAMANFAMAVRESSSEIHQVNSLYTQHRPKILNE